MASKRLVTNYGEGGGGGGYKTGGGGGHAKFYPYEKGVAQRAEGGPQSTFDVVFTW